MVQNNELDGLSKKTTFVNGQEVPVLKKGNGYSTLIVEPEDLAGAYDFIVESGSMTAADPSRDFQNMMTAVDVLTKNKPIIEAEGNTISMTAVITGLLYKLGVKNVDQIIKPQESAMGMNPEMGGQMMGGNPMIPQMAGNPQAQMGGQISPQMPAQMQGPTNQELLQSM